MDIPSKGITTPGAKIMNSIGCCGISLKAIKGFFASIVYSMILKKHSCFRRTEFLTDQDIEWHGKQPLDPNWNLDNHLIAFTLKDNKTGEKFFIAFNASLHDMRITLPNPAPSKNWLGIVNTFLSSPHDIVEEQDAQPISCSTFILKQHSAILLKNNELLT